MLKLGMTLQPFIIIQGPDYDSIRSIYIRLDNVMYRVQNFFHGLESCATVYILFNLEYPHASQNIWYFIQWFIYNIYTPYDSNIPMLYTLRNKIQKLQQIEE